RGLGHMAGTFWSVPENRASPSTLIDTSGVSKVVCVAPGLHTKVPTTAVIGPGVPLKGFPTITSPWTSQETAPVERFTRAWPLRTDHGKVPLPMAPTGLLRCSSAWVRKSSAAVITPAMRFQCTLAAKDADAHRT